MRHLRLYRAVRLIHREGSIRKAAEHLAISPSALNRALQGFEEEIQVALFDRVPGGVQLTAAGELLLDLVERHLADFANFRAMLGDMRAGHRGTLRVSVGADIAAGRVMTALAQTEAAHPALSLEILPADDTTALRRRDVELAILTNPATDDGVEVVFAQRVPVTAWAGPHTGEPPALWDLLQRRVALPPPGTGTRTAISHFLRRRRLSVSVSSSMPAAQVVQRSGTDIDACILPDCVHPPQLQRLQAPLGDVQLAVLRVPRVPLSRPAQSLIIAFQRVFDGETTEDALTPTA